jgi:hypothetical protein
VLKDPLIPVDKDKFHVLKDRFASRFHKHPDQGCRKLSESIP